MSTATCWRAITSSDYLFHVRRWRRWWSNEKTAEPVTTAQACVSAFVTIKLLNIFDVATFSSQKLGSFCCDFGTFPARFSLLSSSKFQPKRMKRLNISVLCRNVMSPTFTLVFPVVQWFKQSTTILQTDWYKPINPVNSICLYNITLCREEDGGLCVLSCVCMLSEIYSSFVVGSIWIPSLSCLVLSTQRE